MGESEKQKVPTGAGNSRFFVSVIYVWVFGFAWLCVPFECCDKKVCVLSGKIYVFV